MAARQPEQWHDGSASDTERLKAALSILEEIVADRSLLGALTV